MRAFLLALALFPLSVFSEGECDANGVCSPMKDLPIEQWWREELSSTQPACAAIDPDNQGTCHQWTNQLTPPAQEVVSKIKTSLAEYISTNWRLPETHRILKWNDQMDELYLSAPGNQKGSDKVFVTPHLDGFFGFIPFARAWRCVYGLSGPHETVTFQPMRNPDQRSVALGPGVFACFDYNRDIHWIQNIPNASIPHPKERIVLKLHYYDYPVLMPKWMGEAFGQLNVNYNFFARRAFLASQFPDQGPLSKLIGAGINAITNYGGNAEVYFGYVNLGIVIAFMIGARFRLFNMFMTVALAHQFIVILAFLFRSVTLGMFTRDAVFLKGVSYIVLGVAYLKEFFTNRGGITFPAVLSLVVALGGYYLATASFLALGADLTYFGQQFGVVDSSIHVTTFPYDSIPHPMILGQMIGLTGLRLHPSFGEKFNKHYLLQIASYALILFLEITDAHVPVSYLETYADFIKFHQVTENVVAHLFTTGIGIIGVLGLLNNFFQPSAHKGEKSFAHKGEKSFAPLVTLGWVWLLVRYTVPDVDVANITTVLMTIFAVIAWNFQLSLVTSLVLIALSFGMQEFAHHYYGEVTYMASYAEFTVEAGLTFLLHNLWLLPFEVRAAIDAASAMVAGK